MSYRIHLGIVKGKDLDNHLSKKFSDSDEDQDEKWDFFYNSRQIELFDEVDIEQFNNVKGYEDEEYPPYVLNKNDIQTILDFYKELLKNNFEKKEEEVKDIKFDDKEDRRPKLYLMCHYSQIANYFKGLQSSGKNVGTSGAFLLDYFFLVRMFENLKDDEVALITHG